MLAHNPEIGLGFDPAAARRLLAEAGYADGKNLPPVTLGYNADEEDHKVVAEAVQGMWQKNLGVLVRLDSQEWKVYLKKLNNDPPHIFRLGWGADYPDPDNFTKVFAAVSGNNHTRWKNPSYDRLLEAAAVEPRAQKRKSLYDQAQKILCETDVAMIPLFTVTETTLLGPRFSGVEYNSMSRLLLHRVKPVAAGT
jgi:oligopeptide transport system substrate-binding protein